MTAIFKPAFNEVLGFVLIDVLNDVNTINHIRRSRSTWRELFKQQGRRQWADRR
jgi:PhoPQ-activated pathogenicity-related protein